MVAAAGLLLLLVPPTGTFVDGMSSRTMWAGLHERMLPQDSWFGIIRERGRLAAAPAEPAMPPPTTGSLPAAPDKAAPVQPAP
jgi:hypothetical protein